MQDFDRDEVLAEQLTRNVQFFGLEQQRAVARAFVVIIGLGVSRSSRQARGGGGRVCPEACRPAVWQPLAARCGGTPDATTQFNCPQPHTSHTQTHTQTHTQGVGSHAAHLLLRSGVGRLRLVDFDQVTLSSLNRHAVAVRADVGTPKATCLQRHFQQIMPEVCWGRAACVCVISGRCLNVRVCMCACADNTPPAPVHAHTCTRVCDEGVADLIGATNRRHPGRG
jgi:hypothetical protein